MAELLWIRNQRGDASPQLWHVPIFGYKEEQIASRVLVKPEHEALGLDKLAKLYPCPDLTSILPKTP
jgi:hypothetical protein